MGSRFPQGNGLMNRDRGRGCRLLDRAGRQFAAAPGRPVRLGQYSERRKALRAQSAQRHDRELGRPGEQDAKWAGIFHPRYRIARAGFDPAVLRCFSSFLVTMRRLSGDR